MTGPNYCQPHRPAQMLKTVAVVAAQRGCEDVLDAVVEAGDYDVVFIESIDCAYTHIKLTAPHVVILLVDVDNPLTLQVLSMLKLDSETSNIPVITHFARRDIDAIDAFELSDDPQAPHIPLSMN